MAVDSLRRLLRLEGEYQTLVRDAREQLQAAWKPGSKELVVVSLADIDHALGIYEQDLLSDEELAEWAEVIVMNDQFEYQHDDREAIASLLFSLSTPEINEPLSRAVVTRMRASLANSQ